jgi:DHA1 family multidrug resistance protein-like MFS transporter
MEGYVYALLYSYFESFPLVYGPEGYDFKGGVEYLPFAALLVGEVFSFVGYALWAWYVPFLLIPPLSHQHPLASSSSSGTFPSRYLSRPIVSSTSITLSADNRYYYEKKFDECRGVIQPEMALPMGIPGAFGLPVSSVPVRPRSKIHRERGYTEKRLTPQISLFWLAWSANRTHWMAPVMSHFVFGACTTWMFVSPWPIGQIISSV